MTAQKLEDADEALEIAIEAYVYAYPLVLMDVTRHVATNVETPGSGRAPINQFVHMAEFPDAEFSDVVRPNADTLYSMMWFGVSKEPLVITVPDSGGRYYLLPMLDMWTDIFASPGKRTTGTGPQQFAIVGPQWAGKLPQGVELLRCPTGMGWLMGRTQADGQEDFAKVHEFQAGLAAIPLSAWGKAYTPPKGKVDAPSSKIPPLEQVNKMGAAEFFVRFADLMKENPPHANDYPILARLKRIGIEPGNSFDLVRAPISVQRAMNTAVPLARKRIVNELDRAPMVVNHWRMIVPPVGTYGTAYLNRAGIAYFGIGANVSEDSIYPTATVDADDKPFDSCKKYLLHFKKGETPPAKAFWSLTMYDERQLFAENPISRYAIGDRDELRLNVDDSLTLYVQRQSPGKDKESNWLPAPEAGAFSMNLRLYWPRVEALDGTWQVPPVERSG